MTGTPEKFAPRKRSSSEPRLSQTPWGRDGRPPPMPQVTEQGKNWLVKLKRGIQFQADPAFKGKKRELSVNDYVYTFKRLMDPKVRSPWQFILEKKVVGLDDLAAQAKKSGTFNYDAKVAGLEVIDPYALRIRLKGSAESRSKRCSMRRTTPRRIGSGRRSRRQRARANPRWTTCRARSRSRSPTGPPEALDPIERR